MNNKVFNFNGQNLSVIINESNEPFFIAKDLCDILGYKNSRKAILDNCKVSDVTNSYIGVVTGKKSDGTNALQSVRKTLINESNLYRLVLKSKLPEAEKFETWVCEEVLPSIRKHGIYATGQTIEQLLESPDTLIQTLQTLKAEKEKRRQAEYIAEHLQATNDLQTKQIEQAKPVLEYALKVLESQSTYTANQIAKELGKSAIELNKDLQNLGVQYKQSETWFLKSKYQNKGFTKAKTYTYKDKAGNEMTATQTVWTEVGRKFIHDTINKEILV